MTPGGGGLKAQAPWQVADQEDEADRERGRKELKLADCAHWVGGGQDLRGEQRAQGKGRCGDADRRVGAAGAW